MKTITVHDIQVENQTDVCLIDVRTQGEYASEHADGAINLPLDSIDADLLRKTAGERTRVYVLCQSGGRARKAVEKLGAVDGYELLVVDGGTNAWLAAGKPSVKGKGVISVERQVRIVAGMLVAIGVALGVWVHPGFLGIPAFVGMGLTFAGITDFCGMGLLLAKMPWNKRGECKTSACQLKSPASGRPT